MLSLSRKTLNREALFVRMYLRSCTNIKQRFAFFSFHTLLLLKKYSRDISRRVFQCSLAAPETRFSCVCMVSFRAFNHKQCSSTVTLGIFIVHALRSWCITQTKLRLNIPSKDVRLYTLLHTDLQVHNVWAPDRTRTVPVAGGDTNHFAC